MAKDDNKGKGQLDNGIMIDHYSCLADPATLGGLGGAPGSANASFSSQIGWLASDGYQSLDRCACETHTRERPGIVVESTRDSLVCSACGFRRRCLLSRGQGQEIDAKQR